MGDLLGVQYTFWLNASKQCVKYSVLQLSRISWGSDSLVGLVNMQLFQLTLADQSLKLRDKISRFCGFFCEKVHQNQLCLVCPVKLYDGEPFG